MLLSNRGAGECCRPTFLAHRHTPQVLFSKKYGVQNINFTHHQSSVIYATRKVSRMQEEGSQKEGGEEGAQEGGVMKEEGAGA